MIELEIEPILARNPMLHRQGRHLDMRFDVFVDGAGYRFSVAQGRSNVVPLEDVKDASAAEFVIRASQAAWRGFVAPNRPPQFHDLIAMVENGHASVAGELLGFFRDLFFVKGMLAAAFRGDASW